MAKVSLNKLTPIKSLDKKSFTIGDEEIQVVQYLPAADKALFCERVITMALDPENKYISRSRLAIMFALELVKTYTNINITDKMIEDAPKTYDLIILNNLLDKIIAMIPAQEYQELRDKLYSDSDHFEEYLHSLSGILKAVTADYSNTELDAERLMNEFKNPEQYKLLTDILDKIG